MASMWLIHHKLLVDQNSRPASKFDTPTILVFKVLGTKKCFFLFLKGKVIYTFGNCQRPVFSLGVSQHKHKITSLWTFELNWSSKLWENDERQKHPFWTNLCAFRSRRRLLEVVYYFSENLPLSQNLCYFKGSRFSQCFILSTALQCSLPSEFLSYICLLWAVFKITKRVHTNGT